MKHLFVLSLITVFILSSFAVYAGVLSTLKCDKQLKFKMARDD